MQVHETDLPGVLLIEPKVFRDGRGFFKETFESKRYNDAGIDAEFVQDNLSRSQKNTLRGLHFQIEHPDIRPAGIRIFLVPQADIALFYFPSLFMFDFFLKSWTFLEISLAYPLATISGVSSTSTYRTKSLVCMPTNPSGSCSLIITYSGVSLILPFVLTLSFNKPLFTSETTFSGDLLAKNLATLPT